MCVCVYVLMHVCSCVLMCLCAFVLMYVAMHVLMCEYVNLSMFYCVCLTSELILGRKCWEVYTSEYVTQEEKQAMSEKLYGRAVYPSNYKGHPYALRKQLKENKKILKKRRREARKKKGEYSTDAKVGF